MSARRWVLVTGIAVALLAIGTVGVWMVSTGTKAWDRTPHTSEIVGVWQRGNSDMRMTFYSDHRVTFANIPSGVVTFAGRPDDNVSKPIAISGRWDSFSGNAFSINGAVMSGYSLSNGADGTIYAVGSAASGYELSIAGGDDAQYEYDFHRISKTP